MIRSRQENPQRGGHQLVLVLALVLGQGPKRVLERVLEQELGQEQEPVLARVLVQVRGNRNLRERNIRWGW